MEWDWDFATQIMPSLLNGLIITVKVTIISSALAVVLGLFFAIARGSRNKWVSVPVGCIIEGIRRTPLLGQLYLLFYVLPDFGITLSALAAGIIGLALHYATYMSEVYRAGIQQLASGQWEASKACNLSTYQTWRYIVLPQAIAPMVPPLGNLIIAMFKETPILAAITVLDLMGEALGQANFHYRYLEPIALTGLGLLMISLIAASCVKLFERRLARRAA